MGNTVNFTLYCVTGDSAKVPRLIGEVFGDVAKGLTGGEGVNYRCTLTLQDDSEMNFHVNADPAFLQQHLPGMANFYARSPMANEELAQNVMRQIALFNCVVGVGFEDTGEGDRLNYLILGLFRLAEKLAGFVFVPDGRLMTHQQKVLVAPDGSSEFDQFYPVAATDLIDPPEPEGPEDAARRERSIRLLEERGIPYIKTLGVAVQRKQALARSPREIAGRAAALLAVSVYSEARGSGEDGAGARAYLEAIDRRFGTGEFLSPQELAYLAEEEPEESAVRNLSWRYECCAVMLWALGLWELGYPDAICDAGQISALLAGMESLEALVEQSRPRPLEELLDQADLTLRYDWACVEARIHGEEPPAGLEPGVVTERHYALNWLVGHGGGADWDEINPHT